MIGSSQNSVHTSYLQRTAKAQQSNKKLELKSNTQKVSEIAKKIGVNVQGQNPNTQAKSRVDLNSKSHQIVPFQTCGNTKAYKAVKTKLMQDRREASGTRIHKIFFEPK